MTGSYGRFLEEKGGYRLTEIPEAGSFEYIFKNSRLFLKVDQFGPLFMQLDPLGGMRVLKRMERETFSPWKVLFSTGDRVHCNFDIYSADSFSITYSPSRCIYDLRFGDIEAVTEIVIDPALPEAFMNVRFTNRSGKPEKLKAILVASFEPVDSFMDVWHKKEWFAKTSVVNVSGHPCFKVHHTALSARKEDRRDIHMVCSAGSAAVVTSYERLRYYTRNFTVIDPSCVPGDAGETYSCEEVSAAYYETDLSGSFSITSLLFVCGENEKDPGDLIPHLAESHLDRCSAGLSEAYGRLVSVKEVRTGDAGFDSFVNCFLPLEVGWVIDLDRGWPTGMRGTRDCSNDFMGYLAYDPGKCRSVLSRIFSSQRRSDGWFPRQIPFGSAKYDMREFVDSGCFVLEFVYEYLSYTDDYSILDEKFCYLSEPDVLESGLSHMLRAVDYYTADENLGEHGLIRLRGGDWLDSLHRVGLRGRAETLMVTAQAILAFREIGDVLHHLGNHSRDEIFERKTMAYKEAIRRCFNDKGYYSALFTDSGEWMFSPKDIDGHMRVYIPSNAYAIIADVDPGKDKGIVDMIRKVNRSSVGYRLLQPPFGNPPFEGLGALGSGDQLPLHLGNGAVYNHGSQLFLIRALAHIGDYENLQDVLDFALPYNQKIHPEKDTCLPMYAITNSYGLMPAFKGRAGMAFLTGTISMIERAIYNWMFGIDFRCESIAIRPCIPARFANASVSVPYGAFRINVTYSDYGSHVVSCTVNGHDVAFSEREAEIPKRDIDGNLDIRNGLRP